MLRGTSLYIDTSALVSAFVQQQKSKAVQRHLLAAHLRVVSPMGALELQATVSRLRREGRLPLADAERVRDLFAHKITSGEFRLDPISTQEWRRAVVLVRESPMALQAADALHVAIAAARKLTLLTADRQQARAAKAAGVKVREV